MVCVSVSNVWEGVEGGELTADVVATRGRPVDTSNFALHPLVISWNCHPPF